MTGPLRCSGRPVDKHLQPSGGACGRVFRGRGVLAFDVVVEQARAAGWRVGPPDADGTRPASCPSCSRPDPQVVAICRELTS